MVALLGAAVARKYGVNENGFLRHYSAQHIIDCMHHRRQSMQDENGCCPTTFEEVFNFLKTSRGIVEEQLYRFQARKGFCRDKCDENPSTQSERSKRIQGLDEYIPDDVIRATVLDEQLISESLTDFDKMKAVIKKMPVAITLESTRDLNEFTGNQKVQQVFPILSRGSGSSSKKKSTQKGPQPQGSLNPQVSEHALLIIGYGTDPETNRKFYLAMNSWEGDDWGFGGYIKLGVDMFPKGSKAFYFSEVSLSSDES